MKSNRAGLEDSPGGGATRRKRAGGTFTAKAGSKLCLRPGPEAVRAADKRGEECANPNKVPEDTNSFLTDDANLALGKFQGALIKNFVFSFLVRRKN